MPNPTAVVDLTGDDEGPPPANHQLTVDDSIRDTLIMWTQAQASQDTTLMPIPRHFLSTDDNGFQLTGNIFRHAVRDSRGTLSDRGDLQEKVSASAEQQRGFLNHLSLPITLSVYSDPVFAYLQKQVQEYTQAALHESQTEAVWIPVHASLVDIDIKTAYPDKNIGTTNPLFTYIKNQLTSTQNLRAKIAETTNTLNDLTEQQPALRQEIAELHNRTKELTKQLETSQNTIDSLSQNSTQATTQAAEQLALIETLKADLKSIQTTLATLQQTESSLKQALKKKQENWKEENPPNKKQNKLTQNNKP